jgi:hypothetical protein
MKIIHNQQKATLGLGLGMIGLGLGLGIGSGIGIGLGLEITCSSFSLLGRRTRGGGVPEHFRRHNLLFQCIVERSRRRGGGRGGEGWGWG